MTDSSLPDGMRLAELDPPTDYDARLEDEWRRADEREGEDDDREME